MADFLIYNKVHHNDTYIKGDIIEVRPHQYYENIGFDQDAFIVISVADIDYDDVKHYHNANVEFIDDDWIVKHNKKFNINIDNIDVKIKKHKIKEL